jgi:hypothetical protein
MTTTYQRHMQIKQAARQNRIERAERLYDEASVSYIPGWYPVNPTPEEAYSAAFQSGLNIVFNLYIENKSLELDIWPIGPTASDAGWFDGYQHGKRILQG